MATNGRFLTTHVGSLPRPEDLMEMMWAREDGIPLAKAEILSLAAKLYSERGWLEYGSPEGLNALIALHLQGLRRSLRR